MFIVKDILYKVILKFSNYKNLISFNNSYHISFENYYYNSESKSYILVFRLRYKSTIQKFSVQEIFFDKNFLNELHPIDAYKVGIIFGMQRNNVIFNNNYELNIDRYSYESHPRIKPMFLIKNLPLLDDYEEVVLHLINSKIKFIVKLQDITKKSYLLYGLEPIHAATLGLLISEYFIKKFTT